MWTTEKATMEMNERVIQKIAVDTGYYETPHLNSILYLNGYGFTYIDGLEAFTSVVSLWLSENRITKLKGLKTLRILKCLYLQNNDLSCIEEVNFCTHLLVLDLSNNFITKLENLSGLVHLEVLKVAQNQLPSLSAIYDLEGCPSLRFLDISNNRIELCNDDFTAYDAPIGSNEMETKDSDSLWWRHFVGLLQRLPNLACINLEGNPFSVDPSKYRMLLIEGLPQLKCIDDAIIQRSGQYPYESWTEEEGGIEEGISDEYEELPAKPISCIISDTKEA